MATTHAMFRAHGDGRCRSWQLTVGAAGALLVLAGCGGSTASAKPSTGGTSLAPPAASTSGMPVSPASAVTATVASFRLPATLSRAVATAVPGGGLVVMGGLHDGDRSTGAVLSIDPASAAVRVTARLPVPVHDIAGGNLVGVPTSLGGGSTTEVAAVQQPAGSGGSVVGQLPTPTSDAVAATTDRGLVLVGGYDGTHSLGQILLIDSPGHVQRIGTLPVPVRYPAVTVTGRGAMQRVLVFGGESSGVATTAVQEVDPATGRARLVGRLPAPRTQASALTLGGSAFLFGGASSGTRAATTFADVLRWNPATAAFTAAGRLPYPVADVAAVSPDGQTGYLIGGETPSRVATSITVRVQ